MREIYAERLGVLQEEASARLAGLIEISGIDAAREWDPRIRPPPVGADTSIPWAATDNSNAA